MRYAIILLAALHVSGCAALQGVCADTIAQRTAAQSMLGEAQVAVDQAAAVIAMIPQGEQRAKALDALAATRAGLRSAASALAGVDDACTALDVRAAFADFARAWRALLPFLALFGGPGAEPMVSTPMAAQL